MTMDELREERDQLAMVKAIKQTELEIAITKLQLTNRRIQDICTHKDKSGIIIKFCRECGKADFFWNF
ncbi:hypothetical protein HOBO_28 [Bacillus phage Hobo]|uniref:Uncharacterized protein n=2 Tax=Caeruleovirus BM15 TaxID=1985178 RepID=A0A0S2MUC3_9CAUD|nr:hypothetical protein FD732_gp028 [Bacillus phage BM15]ALO79449.1 hypothetical protein BM10_28 [Bacillus phage BM15]AXQ66809.1 hypothetical protein HOBO_28 [Bacillus phage Hobo]